MRHESHSCTWPPTETHKLTWPPTIFPTQPCVVYDIYGSPLGTPLKKKENCSTAHQLNCSITRHCLIIAHTCAKDGSSSSAACPAERVIERASSSLSKYGHPDKKRLHFGVGETTKDIAFMKCFRDCCASSLISPRWCVYSRCNGNELSVSLGSTSKSLHFLSTNILLLSPALSYPEAQFSSIHTGLTDCKKYPH